ncbi:TetR/AcrR family transcriptional regulator [bacterium]|nr:TetR/AcrR family transcriptional regulator [bacterium]MBU1994847.1 TetR/AcrR family transcriptional regulator [bacterium]
MTKKELIIQTAQELFAKNGYAATSIDDITKPCYITKAAIYYHFKDKNALYESILQNNLQGVAEAIEKNIAQYEDVEQKLHAYIVTFAKELNKNKNVSSLLMREMSNGGENMPTLALKQMLRIFKILTLIIQTGTEKKVFHCVEPVLIQMMVVGSLSFLINTQKVRHKIQNEIDSEAQTTVDFSILKAAEKIAAMILNSLKHGETL